MLANPPGEEMKSPNNSAGRVVNIGGRSRSRGIRNTGYSLTTKSYNGILPQPQKDWVELRRLKLKCQECPMFDQMEGGCYRHLLPDQCGRNKTGVMV